MEQHLRLATRDDLVAIRKIVRDAYAPYTARIGREPGPMGDDYDALIGADRVHVVLHENVVRGLVVLVPSDGAMRLDNVCVAPEAQGLGLGRRMLAFAERAAIEAGHGIIELYTNETMTENIALYRRGGFVETHRLVENGFRRVYMRKVLETIERI